MSKVKAHLAGNKSTLDAVADFHFVLFLAKEHLFEMHVRERGCGRAVGEEGLGG